VTDPREREAQGGTRAYYVWEIALVYSPDSDYDHARAHLRPEGSDPDGGGPALCGYDPGAELGASDFVWLLKAPDDGVCADCVGRMLFLGGIA
jgi:hypothetical protein